ncbi:MAG TPA: DUF6531 domain-containing protein [Solirubrobacteraceae bacterium]|jgi:RHS repeat-associated protein
MRSSSARPDALDLFAANSRGADEQLRRYDSQLTAAYDEFRQSLGWGTFDADSLLQAFRTYIGYNETDAQWVKQIAIAFRRAGGDGSVNWLPDAAIAASLRAAGLDHGRAAITFDAPSAYGFPPTTGYVDDPVNTASGNFVARELDLDFPTQLGELVFARFYNSRSDRTGAFGRGWTAWPDVRLRTVRDGVEYAGPDGQREVFPRLDDGFSRVPALRCLLRPDEDGHVLDWFDGRRWAFDAAGRPSLVRHGAGTDVRLGWDGERLVELVHADGTRVDVEWDGERVAAVAASDGRRVDFGYDEDGNLAGADRQDGARRYLPDPDGRIAEVVDADGVVEVRNRFDAEGRVLEQWSPFGRRTLFAYLPGHVTVTGDGADAPANTYLHDGAGRLVGIIDGNGERFSVNYDAWGNPTAVTERNGAVTLQEWDERARLVKQTLPAGAEVVYGYDGEDRLVSVRTSDGASSAARYEGDARNPVEVTDAEGGVTRLVVEDGLIRKMTDPDGVVLRLDYDGGRLAAVTDAEGNVARLERDAAGSIVAAETPLRRRTTYEYDEHGRLSGRRDPAGNLWRAEFSEAGRVLATVDPTGSRTEVAYGAHGHPVVLRDPLGVEVGWSYDPFGNLAAVEGPGGRTWRLEHDAVMRLARVVDPAGAEWRREYDVNGALIGAIDPAGVRVSATVDASGRVVAIDDGATSSAFELDGLGRVVSERRPDGSETRVARDRCGRPTRITRPGGATTQIEYSPAGRVRRIVHPSGREETLRYDARGHLAARVDGAGREWTFRYDADGALVERRAPDGATDRYAYDAAGRLVGYDPAGGPAISLGYDAAGRVVEQSGGASGTQRFAYDAAGRLIEAVDGLGAGTTFAYDADGRLVRSVDPLGAVTARAYDVAGRLAEVTDPLGRATTFAYDGAGRLVERTDGSARTVRWRHDASGRVAAIETAGEPAITVHRDLLARVDRISEGGRFEHALRWDAAGRLVERRRDDLAIGWTYDEDGLRTAVTLPDGTATRFRHDAGGLVAGLEHPALGEVTLERDAAGRVVGLAGQALDLRWERVNGALVAFAAGGRATTLSRDDAGRVVAADGDVPWRFTYDAAGQLIGAAATDRTWSFAYDGAGRLAEETQDGATVRYEHDAAGQLVARHGASEATIAYDGAGRRVSETTAAGARSFEWDAFGRLSAVEDPAGRTSVAVDALGELAQVGGADLLWSTGDALPELLWLGGAAVIGAGTPIATVRDGRAELLAPDWRGTPQGARDPWGAPAAREPAIGFRGEVEVAGVVWLRERLFDPADRTFLTPDPLPFVPGTAWSGNPYHYAGNDPVGRADPLGLRPVTDAELRAYRDDLGRNVWQQTGHWVAENKEYLIAGALIVGGVAVAATGFGGPVGAAMISGGLISAGASTGMQKLQCGHVDTMKVLRDGAIGAAAAGIGAAAGVGLGMAAGRSGSVAAQALKHPYVASAVRGATEEVVGGMAERGLHGENPLDGDELFVDTLLGGSTGVGTKAVDDIVAFHHGGDPRPVIDPVPSSDATTPKVLLHEFGTQGFTRDPLESVASRLFEPPFDAGKELEDAYERYEPEQGSGSW